jgi:hypothetical protein
VSKKWNSKILNEFTAGNTTENNPWLPMVSEEGLFGGSWIYVIYV